MIDVLEVGNVRLFAGEALWKFDLPRLGVLCGTNSAGKSTLLKLLLLLRQSQGIGEALQGSNGKLRLVGSQLDLGSYEAFVSHQDASKDVVLGISIGAAMPRAAAAILKLWKAQGQRLKASSLPTSEGTTPYRLRARFTFGRRARPRTTGQRKGERGDTDGDAGSMQESLVPVLKRATFSIVVDGVEVADWQIALIPTPVHEPIGPARYEMLIPSALLQATGWLDMVEARTDERSGYTAFPATVLGVLPAGITVRVRSTEPDRKGRKRAPQFAAWPLPFPISNTLDDLKVALTNIHYLGPLRALPKRYYVSQGAAEPGMDAAGDFLPYVLRDRGAEPVVFTPPMGARSATQPLVKALDGWLRYLRTGEPFGEASNEGELAIATTRDVLVELSLRSTIGGASHALADSGFGYSQVLPILVRGLLAPTGSTLIVEQPELHLNPSLQVRLAEFFVGLARAGKQVLLETHSEHVVNSMRVLAAESEAEVDQCAVFFLDAPNGKPEVHRLEVASDGIVENWPRNFFGEAANLRGRLLRAQGRARPSPNRI